MDEMFCSTCYRELEGMVKERDAEISSLQKEVEILNDALSKKEAQ
jgi:ribosomal protein L34E